MEDETILALYEKRDEQAIAATRTVYGPLCHKIALGILSRQQDAEECVSDALLRAWNAIPPLRPRHLGAWLGKVVRNLAINRWNREHTQRRNLHLELSLQELEDCIPDARSPEKVLEGKELSRFLNQWLASIPKEDRILFVRRYWLGVPLKELEQSFGISHGKMAKRMYNLRQRLRQALEQEGYTL